MLAPRSTGATPHALRLLLRRRPQTLPSLLPSRILAAPRIALRPSGRPGPSYSTVSGAATDASSSSASATAPRPSLLRRVATFVAIGLGFTSLGFALAVYPAMSTVDELLNPPTSKQTLSMFVPRDDEAREIEAYINRHPLTLEMRGRPDFVESRPHMKIPPSFRSHNLTGGTLMGPGRIAVPPLAFAERGGRSLVSVMHLGDELCGHPGIVHGGLLATLLDEGLARCCFAALPHRIGLTATLNINYRSPAPAGSYVVLRATTTRVEGRKAWVEGRIETLVADGEKPVILAEATALFVSPKQAAAMVNIHSAED